MGVHDMTRTAIIENGIVTNVVMHDPDGTWIRPDGVALVASETAGVGDGWDGVSFTPMSPAPSTARANDMILAELGAIDAKSIRPLRAILAAQAAGVAPDPTDVAYLAGLKSRADALRSSLAT
ncbi:hypothetical protein amb4274 [Paramagnetospirillum magneticum AMB-1]|uniref:Uncharacterized protein n=2 Tax=Paramagnetospirillum magneticum TaxID=84159 RepID=Q2VZ97_PARM1|nr:hypothetical protein amb4274 [Paramagnetospirillum magneticum AMB-1]